ncbi:TVP38/TMEM64 family protein [Cytobacillus praedii]|uniref:TVP38/TMEM64 family membrane protein n=1 Tax=Cytobacillus praedii TaxID=1742358 RepID=A0A4R1AW77_9BACI|nr:TVP38/TMEM64 family protein [Cytobacillus praedii]MED3572444.1 TVP38/TMEM64 family protein [Cytobacillus praedii]TCJ04474.1 TVP38/TMEM64 family protein [Cytobacillus praedii]
MDYELFKDLFTLENIMDLIEKYRSFGPLPGLLLPMLEAFLPFLPLFIFVMANANAFGLWFGFLLSWIGSTVGALLVFLLVRKYGQKRMLRFLKKSPKVQKLMAWVERHGFGPLFILLCFPFTPSAVVNIVAGLSKISIAQYMLAVLTGKMVMIFTMSFVGYDIKSLITQPARTAIVGVIIFILWYVGKRIEIKMNISTKKHRNYEK